MKIHPRHHVLEGFLARLVPETRLLIHHVLSCRRCRTAALVALEELSEGAGSGRVLEWPSSQESFVTEDLLEILSQRRDAFEREQALAPSLVAEILGCPASQRRDRAAEHDRFHTAAFVMSLLDEGRGRLVEKPFEGVELIDVAREVSERLDPEVYGQGVVRDLRARAWAYAGDAHRRCGDLAAAEDALSCAEELLSGTGDPLEEARFFQLKAALLRDQRSFKDSQRLQRRALRELKRCRQGGID